MEDLPVMWIMVGMAVLILGPAGAAWVDVRRQVLGIVNTINTMAAQWDEDRKNTREWLKDIQTTTHDNSRDIAVLTAILKERTDREASTRTSRLKDRG